MRSENADILLGLDVGGTKCAALLGTCDGQVTARREFASRAERGPEAMLADLVAAAREISPGRRPAAAGVSIGGPLDAARGVIHSPPNLPGWDAFPLKARLEEALGIPASVEHDAAACAVAEHRWGAGQGAKRLAYLTCGTGFGAGLVFDGRPYCGANGRNVELGHWRIREIGPEGFGKAGSAEGCCSAKSLARWAAFLAPGVWPADVTSEQIARSWKEGDANAVRVVEANARAVGDVCAILADLLQLDLILLGSLARYLGEPWVERVRAQAESEWLNPCEIVPAGLGDRLQDLSALAVARVP